MTKVFNRKRGSEGEEIATKFLADKGFKILERNYSTKFGEIDLVVIKDNILRFVEVKLKKGDFFGAPEEMIGASKLSRVIRMSEFYLMEKPEMAKKYEIYSIDAVCIVINENEEVERINLYENIGF